MSPLYIGPQPLSRDRLGLLERRLRDVLVGDVVRGIQVGIDGGNDSSMGRAGALELVEMRWVWLGILLGQPAEGDEQAHTGDAQRPVSRDLGIDTPPGFGRGLRRRRRALCISLQYENALCTAILMPTLSSADESGTEILHTEAYPSTGSLFSAPSTDNEHFLHLPLLLLRMPPPLKPVILDFISATFDCRIHPLRLGTQSLTQAWERWLREAGVPTRGPLAKDVVITVGFYAPSITSDKGGGHQKRTDDDTDDVTGPVIGIKAIDIIIPAGDIKRFTETGKRFRAGDTDSSSHGGGDMRKRRRLGGQTNEEGWGWRTLTEAGNEGVESASLPFTEALGRYIDRHLALDIFHPAVRILRVACGAFVLSEGRVKVFAPTDTTEGQLAISGAQHRGIQSLIAGLIERARGKQVA